MLFLGANDLPLLKNIIRTCRNDHISHHCLFSVLHYCHILPSSTRVEHIQGANNSCLEIPRCFLDSPSEDARRLARGKTKEHAMFMDQCAVEARLNYLDSRDLDFRNLLYYKFGGSSMGKASAVLQLVSDSR